MLRIAFGQTMGRSILLLLMLSMLGCGGDSNADGMLADMNNSNIKRVANQYAMYQLRHAFKGPKDEAEFLAYIQQQDEKRLQRIGIDKAKIDDLMTSERDKQKFKIRWGVDTVAQGPSDPVVFEETGVDGKRSVAFTGGEVVEADSAKYDQFWKGEGRIASQERLDGGQGQ